MATEAKFVTEVWVVDPETGGVVHVGIYKHQNGGMLGVDSSYIEQVIPEDSDVIYDPFAPMGEPEDLYLIE
jgi:hypothetical protein